MITANVRVKARLVRGKVNTPLSKKSIVKNPLQVNKRTARTSWSIADRGKRLPFSEIGGLGACPRLDESTADALGVARSSDPFRGMLKKAASCVLCRREA